MLDQYSEVTLGNSYAQKQYNSAHYAQKYTVTELYNY
jgi:hypothetical protein